jgi:hypothetical protein
MLLEPIYRITEAITKVPTFRETVMAERQKLTSRLQYLLVEHEPRYRTYIFFKYFPCDRCWMLRMSSPRDDVSG